MYIGLPTIVNFLIESQFESHSFR